mmetsp:Transcript_22621/g.36297  ORF Transcript_22621/g.36297 Transcript_22621/m.36297 type:complete len:140 (+) Transcript_22621:85-504(+)
MNDTMEVSSSVFRHRNQRLPPEVNRILYVKNLPFNIKDQELYDVFGRYGAIRQIRKGVTMDTRGTAFVIYEDIYEAKAALEALSGFNVKGRYLVVLYHQREKIQKKKDLDKERALAQKLKEQALKKQQADSIKSQKRSA